VRLDGENDAKTPRPTSCARIALQFNALHREGPVDKIGRGGRWKLANRALMLRPLRILERKLIGPLTSVPICKTLDLFG
jgi:hypothetical protein